jgi:hypothetical protein
MTNLIGVFRSFASAPKKEYCISAGGAVGLQTCSASRPATHGVQPEDTGEREDRGERSVKKKRTAEYVVIGIRHEKERGWGRGREGGNENVEGRHYSNDGLWAAEYRGAAGPGEHDRQNCTARGTTKACYRTHSFRPMRTASVCRRKTLWCICYIHLCVCDAHHKLEMYAAPRCPAPR